MAIETTALENCRTLLLTLYFAALALPAQAAPSAYAQSNENGPGTGADDNPPARDPNVAGAEGGSKANITLSTATIIVIAVVVGVIVLLGLSSAILFYIAKKRQWEVRKNLRKSAKRVTTAIKAATPIKTNFSRRELGMMRTDPPQTNNAADGSGSRSDYEKRSRSSKRDAGVMRAAPQSKGRNYLEPESNRNDSRQPRDAEKGFGIQTRIHAEPAPSYPGPRQAHKQQPADSFNFDPDAPSRASNRSDSPERPIVGSGPDGHQKSIGERADGWLKRLSKQ